MIARAPGKIVLSGAYAVLEGAPALVAAVDRYVVADTRREPNLITPEVREALVRRGGQRAPWFDAGALRDEAADRKLGLGSSAAILVASLAALELSNEPALGDADLAKKVFEPALLAHRTAQGGGSGIDVAASAYGGVLRFQLREGIRVPEVSAIDLPEPLFVGVWSSSSAASTSAMLSGVAELAKTRSAHHRAVMDSLSKAARAAAFAADGAGFVEACCEQAALLGELGDLADVPIVTAEMRAFADAIRSVGPRGAAGRPATSRPRGAAGRPATSRPRGAAGRPATSRGVVVLPSGAGGGDVVLTVSTEPQSRELEAVAHRHGFVALRLTLGARGVHALREPLVPGRRNETSP